MVKMGFIGFGRMGITHYSILNIHPSVQVAAICDSSAVMLGIIKKYLGVPVYSQYREMLEESDLDAVIVSTPGDSHLDIVKAAIEKDLHIFVEKPFALSTEEGKAGLEMIKSKPLVNQVGYVNRFNEVFTEVKALLEKDIVGEVKSYVAEMYGATVLKSSGSSWRAKKNTGGGCLYEFASHCIDMAIYLFGHPAMVTGSTMQSVYSSDVEDMISSTFIHQGGFAGTIIANWSDETYRKPTNILTIFGTKGKIIADKHGYKVYVKEDRPDAGFEKGWNERYITEFGKPVRFYLRGNEFTSQFDYFVDRIIESRTDNISSFADAFQTDLVIEEIRDDACRVAESSGRIGNVSPPTDRNRKSASRWKRIFG